MVVSRVSHQPREPVVHSLGSDAEGPADPTPRQTGMPGSADLAKQLLIQQLLQARSRLQRSRWIVAQALEQVSPFRQLRHPEIFSDHPQEPQENHGH